MMTCDQCEEEFNNDMIKVCLTCGGDYCNNCITNHELCCGDEF